MTWTDKQTDMKDALRSLNKAIPEVAQGFGQLSKAVKTDGVLDIKTKELIAVAISVADRCEACIGFHIEALIRAGGTREELSETLGMAVQMGGGPSLMYSAKALACFDEFTAAAD
ncbi:alkylhydroperoxidase AhpD family core domain-containing protein [Salinihabitans flavidus]|uniref:Alkylhydroperoxidase AhpD family core domain-containing protein n=1 Tax=Salinihabitans flavidus TaxID=569882 RepID=A0A1H8LLK0_9RHOB|nr:carboxymuconolactone decarboxylase family protein [Salinihabitans flavidus]SEO06031.1 alkylhydroperoxidase AhpD family core domain-containing protein [Salinihabitans flavidus]